MSHNAKSQIQLQNITSVNAMNRNKCAIDVFRDIGHVM